MCISITLCIPSLCMLSAKYLTVCYVFHGELKRAEFNEDSTFNLGKSSLERPVPDEPQPSLTFSKWSIITKQPHTMDTHCE